MKWLKCGLLLLMCCCLWACAHEENSPVVDEQALISGVFQGRGMGKSGEIFIDLMLEENRITYIEVLSHSEVPGFDEAMIRLQDEIITKNSAAVDVVASATLTSRGFLEAVEDALNNAGVNEAMLAKASLSDASLSKQEIDCDLVIVGGGGAGFTAAIEALSEGVENVVIVEKVSFGGGNTRMSGGEYAAPGNWVQLAEGISDSKELFFEDIMSGGYQLANPDLVRIIVENALPNAEWLRDYVGVQYRDYQSWYGGHSVARTLWPIGDGPQYMDTLIAKAEELGVQVYYNTQAVTLLQDEQGAVIGVKALQSDKEMVFHSKLGVILTTGGFGANVEMRMMYDQHWLRLDETIPTTNSPAITGDGIRMAEQVGAQLVGMEYIQLYPVNNPATGNYYFMDYARLNSNALLVNKEGERFVDEKETRDNIASAALEQQDAMIYELIDEQVIQEMEIEELYAGEIAKCLDQGVLVKGTLEECAKFFDIPYENLKTTLLRYNQMAEQGKDLDFGRKEHLRPIEGEEFLMFSSIVSVHHTMGGVKINTHAQVLDIDDQIIEGLYAAGEVTGGIHGGNRLGSMSMPDTVAFGRIAAQSAISFGAEHE